MMQQTRNVSAIADIIQRIRDGASREKREKILISACLMGEACRYDGGHNYKQIVEKIKTMGDIISFCPEEAGGLSTPRTPVERCGLRVITADGDDVTEAFEKGAKQAAALAIQEDCCLAIMKSKSPSCGNGTIYDGTFTHTLRSGDGVTVEALRAVGIEVITEAEAAIYFTDTNDTHQRK